MKKTFKRLLSLSLACAMLLSMGVTAFASEGGNLKVKMPIFTIDTDYSINEAYVEYSSQGNKAMAVVRDINTSNILEEYTEIIKENSRLRNTGHFDVIMEKKYNPTSSPTTQLRVMAEATMLKEVTASITRYYIVSINGQDHDLIGSGEYDLESKRSTLRASTQTNCDINIAGVLKTTRSQTIGGEVNFELLKSLGFSISGSQTTEWTARKSYNTSVRLSV